MMDTGPAAVLLLLLMMMMLVAAAAGFVAGYFFFLFRLPSLSDGGGAGGGATGGGYDCYCATGGGSGGVMRLVSSSRSVLLDSGWGRGVGDWSGFLHPGGGFGFGGAGEEEDLLVVAGDPGTSLAAPVAWFPVVSFPRPPPLPPALGRCGLWGFSPVEWASAPLEGQLVV